MADWKDNLSELYKVHRDQQKNTKGIKSKFETVVGHKNKKGFSDTGVPITAKSARSQSKNISTYKARGKGRYDFSRLRQINDARAGAARSYRMKNHEHRSNVKGLIDKFFDSLENKKDEIVDEVSNTKAPAPRHSLSDAKLELQFGSPRPFRQKHYYWSDPKDDLIEVPITRSEELGEPRFRNKIEESIWRLKQKK